MSLSEPRRGGGATILLHPLFTGSVALLGVNDHVLKGWAPGWFTGKASDFAGVVVAALAVGVVVRWPAAVAGTAVAWVALKTVPEISVLLAPVLGGPTRTDPTDLVALAALWPAGRLLAGASGSRITLDLRAVLVVPILAVTVMATTATSCEPGPSIAGFEVSDGTVTTIASIGFDHEQVAWATSTDGGQTWTAADRTRRPASHHRESCRDDGRCFRVRDGRGVDEFVDGTWRESFAFSDEEMSRLELRTSACDNQLSQLFESTEAAPGPDGEVVLVTMADQGALRLDPVAGEWERVAISGLEPVSLTGPSWLRLLYLVPLGLLVLAPVLGVVARRRSGRAVWMPVVGMGVSGVVLLGVALVLDFSVADYLWAGPTIAGLSVFVFLVSFWLARRPRPPLPPPPKPFTPNRLPPPP